MLVHQKHHQESKVLMTPRRDQRRTQTRRRLPLLRRPRRTTRKRSKSAAALNLKTPDHPQMRSQSSQRGLEPPLTLVLKVVPAIPAPRRARPLRSKRSKRYRKRRRPLLHLPPVQEAIVTSQRSLLKKLQQRKLLRAHLQALIVTATSHKRRHQSRRLPPHPVAPVAILIQMKSQSRRLQ